MDEEIDRGKSGFNTDKGKGKGDLGHSEVT